MKAHAIYHNFSINAPAKKVFEAVSIPRHLNNWWTLKSEGKPELNEIYNLNFTDKYDWYCMVSVCVPHTSFHLKMTQSDKDWNPTTFGFELEEKEGKTNVRFSHVDWSECNDHFKITSFCWAILLNGLKNYIEKGTVIPFEERN